MKRTMLAVALGGCCGFLLAAGTALGYAKLNAWRGFGENFQLGYVVGYLDAVKLAKRSDMRAMGVPSQGAADYERWRKLVNEFYADPANVNRPVPDAMGAIGKKIQDELMKSWSERRRQRRRDAETAEPVQQPEASPVPKAP